MTETLPEPKSRTESYLAKAAGEDVTLPEKPLSRTEQYLNAIAENSGGGGATYTAGDGITISGDTISVDTTTIQPKLTAGNGIDITNAVISAGATTLTEADYNYPTSNPTEVALWLLDDGFYTWGTDITAKVRPNSQLLANYYSSSKNAYVVTANGSGTKKSIILPVAPDSINGQVEFISLSTSVTDGAMLNSAQMNGMLTTSSLANNLTTSSNGWALDAKQGKVLKDLVDSIAIRSSGAPTTSTVGAVGTLYEDTTNGKLYQCTAVDTSATPNTYTWTEVGAGGGAGGSGVTTLTTADYNYPVNNPQYIALSLLPDGIYRLPVGVDIGMYGINSAVVENTLMQNNPILFLSTVNGNKRVVAFPGDFSTYSGSVGGEAILMFTLDSSNTLVDSNGTVHSVITTAEVIDNLTTPYSISPLSANQGMALNNKITPDSSSGAPTTATVGILGKIYIDTATNNAYMCTAVDDVTQSYTWKQITS